MTELQEARAKWIDAEERAAKYQKEAFALLQENYKLKGDLYASQAEVTALKAMHWGFVAGVFGMPAHGSAKATLP